MPWDTTEENLKTAFEKFGPLKVEWPSTYSTEKPGRNSKGKNHMRFISWTLFSTDEVTSTVSR